tara:strand:- start:1016 stop:1984 length:969 start_codon:yes stop_codon:yes gene_type:complete
LKKQKIIINTLLSLGLGCILVYLVFDNIDLNLFLEKLSGINYLWIYLSMFISIFEHVLRGYRWNLLMDSSGKKLTTYITTNVMIVSYFFALFIPRFNDIARCYLISKTNNIKISTSLGTVFSERIFDLISLLILSAIFILIEFDLFYGFIENYVLSNIEFNTTTYLLIFGSLIVLFFILRYFSKKSSFISSNLNEFKLGVLTIKENYKNKGFLISTFLLWLIYFLMGYVIFFSFTETTDLGINAGIAVLVAGSIGMIVPVNAGIGAYHFLVASILLSYNLDYESGLFFATLLHTSQIVCLAILGIISSIILFFKIKSNNEYS